MESKAIHVSSWPLSQLFGVHLTHSQSLPLLRPPNPRGSFCSSYMNQTDTANSQPQEIVTSPGLQRQGVFWGLSIISLQFPLLLEKLNGKTNQEFRALKQRSQLSVVVPSSQGLTRLRHKDSMFFPGYRTILRQASVCDLTRSSISTFFKYGA